jgi:hypothetical protein
MATSVTGMSTTVAEMPLIIFARNSRLATLRASFELTGTFMFFHLRDRQYLMAFEACPEWAIGAMCPNVEDLFVAMIAFFEWTGVEMSFQL